MRYLVIVITLLITQSSVVYAQSLVFNTTGKSPLNRADKSGFMDKVVEQSLSELGYKLETVKNPAERGLKNVNIGIDDAEMSRIAGLEKIYPNLRLVPEKIMDWEFVVFSKNNIAIDRGWKSLEKRNIAFINGWKILEKNVPANANVEKVKNEKQLFTLLDKDRTELIIYEKWAGLEIIKKNNYKDIKLQEPALAVKEMFIYLNKKHEKLTNPLANALKNMKADGSYQQLEKQILVH